MAQEKAPNITPLSWGPLPSVDSLSSDRAEGNVDDQSAAPWVDTWREMYVTVFEGADCDSEKPPSWSTVVNRHPSSEKGAGVPPQLGISPIVFGVGTFGTGQYSSENLMFSLEPVRAVRLALLSGINAFDASPFYKNSEAILGRALAALKSTIPRSTYYLSTKCGRYGPTCSQFDYSPARVRQSVEESIVRLDAEGWLDNVFMHDAEFISTPVGPAHDAGMVSATIVGPDEEAKQKAAHAVGIEPTFAAASKVHGPGDQRVLEAVRELFKLKDEGKIKMVGISGYPLPVLLRLARMIATNAPYRPLDSLLSYSNHTLHSDTLQDYITLFRLNPWTFEGAPSSEARGVDALSHADNWVAPLVMNASPFSMGLLTEAGPPAWHPANQRLHQARKEALEQIRRLPPPTESSGEEQPPVTLAETALHYGTRGSEIISVPIPKEVLHHAKDWPQVNGRVPALRTLAGLANEDQVRSAIEAYRVLSAQQQQQQQTAPAQNQALVPASSSSARYVARHKAIQRAEQAVLVAVKSQGVFGETWESPPPEARDVAVPL